MEVMSQIIEIREDRNPLPQAEAGTPVIPGVKVLGQESKNGRKYPLEVMKKALEKYNGALVNIDHPEKDGPRKYEDRFGRLVNPRLEADGIYADLHYNPKHPLAEGFAWWAKNDPSAVGLSHNAQARTSMNREGVEEIEEIVEVTSVDLVAEPATTAGLLECVMRAKNHKVLEQDLSKVFEGPEDAKIDQLKAVSKGLPTKGSGNIDAARKAAAMLLKSPELISKVAGAGINFFSDVAKSLMDKKEKSPFHPDYKMEANAKEGRPETNEKYRSDLMNNIISRYMHQSTKDNFTKMMDGFRKYLTSKEIGPDAKKQIEKAKKAILDRKDTGGFIQALNIINGIDDYGFKESNHMKEEDKVIPKPKPRVEAGAKIAATVFLSRKAAGAAVPYSPTAMQLKDKAKRTDSLGGFTYHFANAADAEKFANEVKGELRLKGQESKKEADGMEEPELFPVQKEDGEEGGYEDSIKDQVGDIVMDDSLGAEEKVAKLLALMGQGGEMEADDAESAPDIEEADMSDDEETEEAEDEKEPEKTEESLRRKPSPALARILEEVDAYRARDRREKSIDEARKACEEAALPKYAITEAFLGILADSKKANWKNLLEDRRRVIFRGEKPISVVPADGKLTVDSLVKALRS